jgi:hypothetical protein
MSNEVLTLIITIALAFTGYLFTYLNNLRLSKREAQLALIDKRIKDFYGPLHVSTEAGRIAYEALLEKLGKKAVFDPDDPPTRKELKEWLVWSKEVFFPINEFREKLILENAYLIREERVPDCLLQFVTHVSTYKVLLAEWEIGNVPKHTPIIDFPAELVEYAGRSYRELKAEQLRLIGKSK